MKGFFSASGNPLSRGLHLSIPICLFLFISFFPLKVSSQLFNTNPYLGIFGQALPTITPSMVIRETVSYISIGREFPPGQIGCEKTTGSPVVFFCTHHAHRNVWQPGIIRQQPAAAAGCGFPASLRTALRSTGMNERSEGTVMQ